MLGRAGKWVGSTIQGLAAARFWLYQDFAAGSGPGLTITGNSNGSGGAFTFNSANIVNSSAVVTKTNGNPIYTSTTEIPANLVSVSSHTGAAVTLSGTPAVGEGTIRIWYLYVMRSDEAPDDIELAPHFVITSRTQYLDNQFLDSALNLSDLGNASTARTNLGFTNQAAGQVYYGAGGTLPTSESTFFWDSSNKRLGINETTPSRKLHIENSASPDGIRIEGNSAGANRNWDLMVYNSDSFSIENPNISVFPFGINNAGHVGIGSLGSVASNVRFSASSVTDKISAVFRGGTSQTENLTQWQNVGATVLSFVDSAGSFTAPTFTAKTSIVLEDPGAGTNTVTIQAPTLGGSYTLTLPTTDGGANEFLQTDGSGVLTWAAAGGSGTVSTGVAGNLALYPSNGTTVDDAYVQNANNIFISVATHAGLGSTRTYTIPDSGADASFVMTQGAQTLAGVKTFSSTPLLKTALDFEDPGAGTNKITVTAPTLAGDYTLTLPTTDGNTGQFLKTDGSGVTSWERPLLQKAGTVALTNGSLSQAITFATAFGSANYVVHWQFLNTTDADPIIQPVNIMALSTSGFTVEWLQALDSANYVGRWSIQEYYDP